MDDCQQVLSELLFLGQNVVVKKDDSDPCPVENPFVELDAKTDQSVLVADHNLCDSSFLRGDQKPRETASGVLETGTHVLVDFVVWVTSLQRLDLASEVVFLLARRHAGVDGPVALGLGLRLRWRFLCCTVRCSRPLGLESLSLGSVGRGKGIEVSDAVATMTTLRRRRDKTPVVGPRAEGTGANAEVTGCSCALENLRGVGCVWVVLFSFEVADSAE